MSLLLTDGPDGPVLHTLRDVAEAPAALNPPTLTMPASGSVVEKTTAKTPAIERSGGRRIAVVLCVVAIMGAAVLMARARPTRQRNDVALHEAVRARGRGGGVVRRAPPIENTARLDLDVENTARLPRGAVKASVPPRWPRQRNDAAVHAVRAHWREVLRRARPVDDTARLDLDIDNTVRLPRGAVKPSVPREPG
jgi:hypothetical protein